MDKIRAGQLRSIFQHRIGPVLQTEHLRRLFATMTDMSEEEMDIFDEFVGDVGSHLLEGLVRPDQYDSRHALSK